MHTIVCIVALVLLVSKAAVVSAATSVLDFQCPGNEVPVSPSDLTQSAGTSGTMYVLASGTYSITSPLTIAQNTCYVAAGGANVTVIARTNNGYAWVLSQGATFGLQGLTLKGEGQISVAGSGAGGVRIDSATRLVASNVSFVGLGSIGGSAEEQPGGAWNSGGTFDAANITFDSCFSRRGNGGALSVADGQATLTQASARSLRVSARDGM